VLLFVDQLVGMTIAVTNQPMALMIKWGVACIVALAAMWWRFRRTGRLRRPTGLSIGVVASWLAAAVALKSRKRRSPPTGAPA
jgi:hypothetical protein